MRPSRFAPFMLAVLLAAASCLPAVAADGGTISGVVRDADGKPLEGVRVTLTSHLSAFKGLTVNVVSMSGKDGAYSFEHIDPGAYQLTTELSGFTPATPVAVTLSAASAPATADFTLLHPASNIDPTASRPPPKFEAAGVRGLIDPGGYSAPANAAAATGLITGVADIRRVQNGTTSLSAADFPCSLEPDLKRAVDAHPQKAAASRRLGEFYLAHGRATEAIQYLGRARQLDDGDRAATRDLAEALMMSGQFDAARELLAPLTAGRPDASHVAVHRLLARADEGSGEVDLASTEYKAAAALEPTEENLFGVGYELILAGKPAEADAAFTAGLARYPKSVTLLIGCGTAKFLSGHSPEAVELFLKAADLAPSDPRPYSFLAGVPIGPGTDGGPIFASLKRFAELAPGNAEAQYDYALALSHGNANDTGEDKNRVETLLKRAVALDPGLAKAHFQLGTLYAERDDNADAASEFEATLRLSPGLKEAHYRLAAAYRKTGRPEQAAREMGLFRDAGGARTDEGQISIEQFVSVIDPAGSAATLPVGCPGDRVGP